MELIVPGSKERHRTKQDHDLECKQGRAQGREQVRVEPKIQAEDGIGSAEGDTVNGKKKLLVPLGE